MDHKTMKRLSAVTSFSVHLTCNKKYLQTSLYLNGSDGPQAMSPKITRLRYFLQNIAIHVGVIVFNVDRQKETVDISEIC
jgi:hypothetical protein